MVSNGNIPTSQMRQVDGWAWLAPGAAAAWLLFAFKVTLATGRRPTITRPDGGYRNLARQIWWKIYYTAIGKGYLAATPGHSNHGLGLAIDIGNYAAYQHATLVSIAHACNIVFDVSGELWHIHYLGAPLYGGTATTGTGATLIIAPPQTHRQTEDNPMLVLSITDNAGAIWGKPATAARYFRCTTGSASAPGTWREIPLTHANKLVDFLAGKPAPICNYREFYEYAQDSHATDPAELAKYKAAADKYPAL